jgi:hypothetical protein
LAIKLYVRAKEAVKVLDFDLHGLLPPDFEAKFPHFKNPPRKYSSSEHPIREKWRSKMAVKTPSLDQLIDNLLHIITSLDLTAA